MTTKIRSKMRQKAVRHTVATLKGSWQNPLLLSGFWNTGKKQLDLQYNSCMKTSKCNNVWVYTVHKWSMFTHNFFIKIFFKKSNFWKLSGIHMPQWIINNILPGLLKPWEYWSVLHPITVDGCRAGVFSVKISTNCNIWGWNTKKKKSLHSGM